MNTDIQRLLNDLYLSHYTSNYHAHDNSSTINIFMCLRNNSNTLPDTFKSLETIENHFKNYNFSYFIFENDSSDNTPSLINSFMKNRSGIFKCDTLHTHHWDSVKSIKRSSDMAHYRNSMKQLCSSWNNSSFSLILDSNVSFSIDTISDFLSTLHSDPNIAMVTPFGFVHDSPHTYYDTYALLTSSNKRYIPRFIPHILPVHSAFGGIVMIRSHALRNSSWNINPDVLESEHVSFCRDVRRFGSIVILKHTRVSWIP